MLGFGENCAGPVTDLAISPGGARAALRIADPQGARLQRIELGTGAQRAIDAHEDGETHAQARDFAGQQRDLRVPRFPLRTPLRRIDVSTVGLARPATPGAVGDASEPEPL